MNNKDKLISDINNLPQIIRIKEIESFIDDNKDIKALINKKKYISKEIVMCKHIGLTNALHDYEKQYEAIDEEIANYPIVSEYFDLLESAHNDLEIMISYIENNINDLLNKDN